MVVMLEKVVLKSLVPPACYMEHGGLDRILTQLELTTTEARRRVRNLRYKFKKERSENYENFLKRCILHKVDCPEDNTWLSIVKDDDEEGDEVDDQRVSSEKMSRPKMITNGGDRDSGDHHSFVIDKNRIEQSFPGYAVYYHSQVKSPSGEFKCDIMEIEKCLYDPRDAMSIMSDTVVKGELLEDGTGILVTEPMLPKYITHNRSTIEQIHGVWSEEKSTDYIEKMTKYEKNVRNYRYTKILFPPGVIGTTENIRGNQTGHDATSLPLNLKIIPFLDEVPGHGMLQVMVQYASWNIEVKGSVKKMKFDTRDPNLNDVLLKMANLGHMKPMPVPQQMTSPAPQQSMSFNQSGHQQGFFATPAAHQSYIQNQNQNAHQQAHFSSPTAYPPNHFGFAMPPVAAQNNQSNNNGQFGFAMPPLAAQNNQGQFGFAQPPLPVLSMYNPMNLNGHPGFLAPVPAQQSTNGQSVVPLPAPSSTNPNPMGNDQAADQNAVPPVANVGFYYPSTSTVIFLPAHSNPDAISEYGPLLAQHDPWNFPSIEMAPPPLIGSKRPIAETESSTAIIAIAKVEAPTTQKRSKREEEDDISL